jgi:hypothetical protein
MLSQRMNAVAARPTRFYFHLVRGKLHIPDRVGIELSLDVVMSAAAFHMARDVWAGTRDDPDAWKGWSVEIVEANGRVVRVMELT